MKKNFKKSLAVLLVAMMLFSVVSVSVYAATYNVIFQAGSNADPGQTQTVERPFSAKGDIIVAPTADELSFTRKGYTQDGWTTSRTGGGKKAVDFGGNFATTKKGNISLYPFWVAETYDIVFTAGAFGVGEDITDEATFGKNYTLKGAIYTREGYQMVGWATTEGGEQVYALGETVKFESDTTLYPVWFKNIYSVGVSVNSADFGETCVDYQAPAAVTTEITNNGNVTIAYTLPASDNYTITASGSLAIAPGNSVVITVQPKVGLASGDYKETLSFVADNDTVSFDFVAKFVVIEHVFGKYVSNGDATYSKDGTKTAECINGCGTMYTITDTDSMKKFDAKYNTVEGLSEEYIYHRTVRFTAFGSGSDYTEDEIVDGVLRYTPVSWEVNDEFKGDFADGEYDVTFTHTIFGDYTLTVDYVEEKFDEATGSWVPTGNTDQKTFDYTVGKTAEEVQEIQTPQTIIGLLLGIISMLMSLLGIGG